MYPRLPTDRPPTASGPHLSRTCGMIEPMFVQATPPPSQVHEPAGIAEIHAQLQLATERHRRRGGAQRPATGREVVNQSPTGTLSTRASAPPLPGLESENITVADPVIACEDNLAFMERLPDGIMKLIVTSPPYNIGKDYEARTSMESYLDGQRRVIEECVRILNPRGSICWQVGNHVSNGEIVPLDTVLYPLFKDNGLKLRNRVVWHFGHGLHCTKRLSGRYETINWWTKNDDYTWNLDPIRVPSKYPGKRHFKGPKAGQLSGNPKGKNPSDVWEFPNVKNNHPEKTIHPCQFPVELVERLVLSMTDQGDTVFDPYMGVGSSLIAALMHNREAYGCDIVPEYVEIALERVRLLRTGELRTRPMGKPIYDPSLPNGGHR